jgi:DNA invertase Pin-like site-specific DNA recombinase
MNKLVSLLRVSGKKQGKSGLGLEAQRDTVEKYAKSDHGKIIKEFVEIETGTTGDRVTLKEAIAYCHASGAKLVVAKLDRLARNVQFIATLMNSGIDFVCCDNPHATPLTIHILAAVAEDEAKRIRQRTKDALAAAVRRGVKLGSARPGHWKGREHLRGTKQACAAAARLKTERTLDAYRLVIVPRVVQLQEKGKSLREIAEILNGEGLTNQEGKPFNAPTLSRILKRFKQEGELTNA